MNHFKQNAKHFSQKAILLLVFVLLLTTLNAVMVSAGDPDPTLSFTFDEEECTVTLNYQGLEEPIALVSGKPEA